MRHREKGIIFIAALLLGFSQMPARAESPLQLSSSEYYDIYLGSGDDGMTVLKGVLVSGLREVEGVMFLVVHSDSFDKKSSEGLVSLRYIRAVLPVLRGSFVPSRGIGR